MNVIKTIATGTIAAGIVIAGFTVAAFAAPSEQGQCRQDANEAIVALLSPEEGTRGDAMSDGLFGNEPNMADGSAGGPSEQEPGTQAGNVLATQSPGPFVNEPGGNEPPRNDRVRGFGGGDMQGLINESCNP
jgi:hypothetical protein